MQRAHFRLIAFNRPRKNFPANLRCLIHSRIKLHHFIVTHIVMHIILQGELVSMFIFSIPRILPLPRILLNMKQQNRRYQSRKRRRKESSNPFVHFTLAILLIVMRILSCDRKYLDTAATIVLVFIFMLIRNEN